MAECAKKKYKPDDCVNFFKNTVNPQRTCGVIIEQVMEKQYKVWSRDNQHTKVATQNMLPVISQDTEVNPEDINIGIEVIIEDIEEDTGLTQQMIMVNPSPHSKRSQVQTNKDTNPSPWSDEDEVSNPEYPDQQNDSDNNPGNISQAVSNTTDDPEVSQSHNDDPEEPNDAGYPETLDISTGTTQNSDPSTHSDMGQEGTFRPTRTPEKGHPGSEKATQGRRKPGGTKDDYVGTIPFWTNFFKNRLAEDPRGLVKKYSQSES